MTGPSRVPFHSSTTSATVASRNTIGPQYSAASAMRRAACAASTPGELRVSGIRSSVPEKVEGRPRIGHAPPVRIVLCVGGGIAAYKACEVARLCVKAGAEVRCALTPAAQRFVSALTFQALTGQPVATDLFDAQQDLTAGHIALADWADLVVVAPATADLLGRLRLGLADDAVAATLLAIDPHRWLLAPAMNERMWASPATAE